MQTTTLQLGIPVDVWCVADLHEQWDDAAAQPVEDGVIPLQLAPHQIQTLRIRWV